MKKERVLNIWLLTFISIYLMMFFFSLAFSDTFLVIFGDLWFWNALGFLSGYLGIKSIVFNSDSSLYLSSLVGGIANIGYINNFYPLSVIQIVAFAFLFLGLGHFAVFVKFKKVFHLFAFICYILIILPLILFSFYCINLPIMILLECIVLILIIAIFIL